MSAGYCPIGLQRTRIPVDRRAAGHSSTFAVYFFGSCFMLHTSYGTCGVVAENALNVTLNHSNYTGSVKALETTGRKYGHCHSTRYYRT